LAEQAEGDIVLEQATAAADAPRLAKALRSRHVAMISIGGIIGAGLFVNSRTPSPPSDRP